jgi:hypothetical protein
VALEYFAVKPFMDQRLQVLLARNPYQLEKIAGKLAQLQAACGGAVNEETVVLSVRETLLGINRPVVDSVDQSVLSPEERFREILAQGYVPIDKRVRYTTDSTVGDLLKQQGRVDSATFSIGLDNFANLAATCNAKIISFEVQLVGQVGSARPTVSILYDGTSQLRSCQPDIEDEVNLIGRKNTAFGEITSLKVPGRSISPLATVNVWASDQEVKGNLTLGGLPLASQYTVLIDPTLGENKKLDLGKLEDIKLRVRYKYSDLYPVGQCQ